MSTEVSRATEVDIAKKKASSRRRSNTIAAIIIALLLLLLGTFAWGVFQNAVNQVFNEVAPGALLVDIFNPTANSEGESFDKTVRVENTREVPFVVRIQLAEFMQINQGGFQGRDNEYWENIFSGEGTATRNWTIDGNAIFDESDGSLVDSTILNVDTSDEDTANQIIAPMIFNVADNLWKTYGLAPNNGFAGAQAPISRVASETPFAEYWNWNVPNTMTYAAWRAAYDAVGGDYTHSDAADLFNKWVLTDDGYFYYTGVLVGADSVTDVGADYPATVSDESVPLMTGFTATSAWYKTMSFYYAIDVRMEVASQDDIQNMIDGNPAKFGGANFEAAGANATFILEWLRDDVWPLDAKWIP